MAENVPRRLQRFYRTAQEKKIEQEKQIQRENASYFGEDYQSSFENEKENLKRIPSMDYEDLDIEADEKNRKEIEALEKKNLEEKVALSEIEEFKKRNNRLPDENEEKEIAQKIMPELKENPREAWKNRRMSRREERMQKRGGQKGTELEEIPQTITTQPPIITNVKDLFSDESDEVGKKQGSEFDLNLDSDETEEEKIEELPEEGKCPNCKKDADKTIFCPKCGLELCQKCAVKQTDGTYCPRCKARIGK